LLPNWKAMPVAPVSDNQRQNGTLLAIAQLLRATIDRERGKRHLAP
jgi:hypothetical protein